MGCEKRKAFRFWIKVHGGTAELSERVILIDVVSAKEMPMEYGPGPPLP